MDVFEAIRERRMLPRVTPERPAREEIEDLLELAVRAPNHFLTEPWRFYVLTGPELERIVQAMADEQVEGGADPDAAVNDARKKVSRAPVIIVVTCKVSDREGVVEQEEIVSVAMAMQNLLLAAYARGLGAMLRTGAVAYHPAIGRRLGLDPAEKVVGMVYLGRPAGDRALTPRAPAAERSTWLGWDDAASV